MRVDERDQVIVITFQAEQFGDLWRTVEPLIEKGKRSFVIDLGQVKFLNSLSIASIITARNKVAGAGGKLVLAGLADHVKSVFRILKLERLFQLDLPLDDAVTAVK
jgi:anti-anti-sigma factor